MVLVEKTLEKKKKDNIKEEKESNVVSKKIVKKGWGRTELIREE